MSVQLLVQRLLPSANPDAHDRARAWNEWLSAGGYEPVLKFIRWSNGTNTDDEEILQETLIIAYVKVERGQYQDRNLPFTAFLKKIAWYKIMEASRKEAGLIPLDDLYEIVAEDHHEHERVEFWKEHELLQDSARAASATPLPHHAAVRIRLLDRRNRRTARHPRRPCAQREKSRLTPVTERPGIRRGRKLMLIGDIWAGRLTGFRPPRFSQSKAVSH